MPIYKGGTKMGNLYDQLKTIVKRFKSQLVFRRYVDTGTDVFSFNGYKTIITNWFEQQGQILTGDKTPVQSLQSNILQIGVPLDKIAHGVQIKLDLGIANLAADSSYFTYHASNTGFNIPKKPIQVTLSQLKAGYTYLHLNSSGSTQPCDLNIKLTGTSLEFSSTAPDGYGDFLPYGHAVATAVDYSNGGVLSVLIDSITAY